MSEIPDLSAQGEQTGIKINAETFFGIVNE